MSIIVKIEPEWDNEESSADPTNYENKIFGDTPSITESEPQSVHGINIKVEPISPKTPREHTQRNESKLSEVDVSPVLDNDEQFSILRDSLEISNETSTSNNGTNSILINEADISEYKTADDKYMCPVCEKIILYKSIFKIHIKSHNQPLYCCNTCQKTFKKKEIFNKHDCKTYPCTVCGKIFNRGSNLSEHRRKEHPEGLNQCDICNKAYTFKSQLAKHRNVCKKNIPIKCQCGEMFYSKVLYQSHIVIHKQEKYQCDHCKMLFKHKTTLIRHMDVHDDSGNILCRLCNKIFAKFANLKNHIRLHDKNTQFPCPVCDKKFRFKQNMKKHLLRHENPKKLVCNICTKRFPKESRLVYHMRSHTNEKPFQCEFCPKKFTTKQIINRHYKKCHPKNKYVSELSEASLAKEIFKEIEENQRPVITKKIHEKFQDLTKSGSDNPRISKKDNTSEPIQPIEEVMIKIEPCDYAFKDGDELGQDNNEQL